jgi:signal transduction histidine kinase
MLTSVRSLWRLPAPAGATPAGRIERLLLAAVALGAVAEVMLREDLTGRWVELASFLVWLPTLLWMRTRPLLPAVVFAGVNLGVLVGQWAGGPRPEDLGTAVVGLLIPWSLARWAGGRDLVVGLGLFLLVAATSLVSQDLVLADRLGGTGVVVAAIAVGAAGRNRAQLRTRQLDDVRQQERERLARDLHDTVAHHLTAIAISAQAGLAVADQDPAAARDALRRIDEEATRTLAETRSVVRVLRTDDEAPERPVTDLAALADPALPGPTVDVDVATGLEELPPTVTAAVHRIAQEAVANARRHARDATVVRVALSARGEDVELTVTDDGRATGHPAAGFGIVGMTERAALLGGTLEAGPHHPHGWRVSAVLPKEDPR